MFIYLSKKIAIPNNTKLNCLAWNREDGYIAVGGENGLLKVLKLDAGSGTEQDANVRARGLTAASNLSMNQTLEGHTENIQVITWNEAHKKLTTSDQNGVIIVWMIYKNAWYEEMINNRKKSTVVGMAWSGDGLRICIVYEDGAVIVGSVDGNRIWGKELRGVTLSGVQWSPDGKFLLFALRSGELHLYDSQGNLAKRLEAAGGGEPASASAVVGLDWHPVAPLAVCHENGRLQLIRDAAAGGDARPTLVDTELSAVHCRWNRDGTLLAVAGYERERPTAGNAVQFYAADGRHVRTLKVPGRSISCCEWEAGGLRVALAVDSFVYFANIRPDYQWCYFRRTVVYARAPDTVTFWDTSNDQSHVRHVPRLLSLAACAEHCVLATDEGGGGPGSAGGGGGGRYGLLLCNTLGVPVDGVYTDVPPLHAAMNGTHAVVASRDHVLLWRYVTPRGGAGATGAGTGACRVYHADDTPSGAADVMEELGEAAQLSAADADGRPTTDPICCVTCTDEWLVVGRESGTLQQYVLPRVALVRKHRAAARPHRLAINCDGTKCAVLDASGQLTSVRLTDTTDEQDDRPLERKDVWAMCWAADDARLLAVMEKTRMYVLRGAYPEEPIATSGYVCCFNELDITCVLLDELAGAGVTPRADQHLVRLECKSLRDTRQLLDKVGVSEAAQFVEDNPHPRLWRLLGQAALERRDLPAAERAFVRSLDYPAVRFVKRLREVRGDERLVLPLVAAHLGNYDEAERAFLECDRRDLALGLRRTLGDWFRVVQLTKAGGGGTDGQLEAAWSAIGLYFYHRQNWEGAREYLKKSRDRRTLAECLYRLEEYEALEDMARGGGEEVEADGELLGRVARMLVSVGRGSAAAAACLRAGDLRATVELCARQGRWEEAVALARQGELPQLLPDLVRGQAAHVAARDGRPHRAVLLLARAGRSTDAARALLRLADGEAKIGDTTRLVRLYVHAARLAEKDDSCPELSARAWRSAAAHHLLAVAHAHLYAGRARDALVAALRVADMEDALGGRDEAIRALYCLLALAACLDRSFAVCSRAFIRLESLEDGEQYRQLGVSVFGRHGVLDREQDEGAECYNCRSSVPDWAAACAVCFTDFPTCMVTGRPLQDSARVFTCSVCRHCCHLGRVSLIDTCPLCHTTIQT